MAPEEESPMVAHRSTFDTIPAPPPFVALPFPGGDTRVPKPTRADLILSAQQWSKALRDHAVDWNAHNDKARGMFDRLDAVLAELLSAWGLRLHPGQRYPARALPALRAQVANHPGDWGHGLFGGRCAGDFIAMNAKLDTKPLVLLIDLGSIFWPAWFSSVKDELSAAHDRSVNLTRRMREGYPGALVAVCCDSPSNWRKELEPSYKANRPPRDSAAFEQLLLVKETLAKDGLLVWEAEGFEADDVLATACRAAVKAGHEVVVASADKDLTQLVEHGVSWASPKTGELLTRDGVHTKFGVWPEQIRDYLAICGDTSDNVRGVQGVGPKGAVKLLAEYVTLEQVMAEVVKPRAKPVATLNIDAKLKESLAWIATTVKLVSLRYDVPIQWEEIYETREVQPVAQGETMGIEDAEYEAAEREAIEPGAIEKADGELEALATRDTAPSVERKSEPRQLAKVTSVAIAPPSWDLALEPTTLGLAYKLAQDLANSRLYTRFPSAEAIFAVIIRGREMGLGALTSLDLFHIVEGKPAPHAHFIIARAKGSHECEYLEYVGGDSTYAEWEGQSKRGAALGRDPVRLRYTIDQAKKANVVKQGSNWEKRPDEMLRKTAGVQLARVIAPGATMGLYSQEELAG
jgi:5'-3' exonuclease